MNWDKIEMVVLFFPESFAVHKVSVSERSPPRTPGLTQVCIFINESCGLSKHPPLRTAESRGLPSKAAKCVIVVFPMLRSESPLLPDIGTTLCYTCSLEFRFFVTFSAIMWLICDQSVIIDGGNRSTCQNPPPNPRSLATLSHVPAGIQTQAVVRDS